MSLYDASSARGSPLLFLAMASATRICALGLSGLRV